MGVLVRSGDDLVLVAELAGHFGEDLDVSEEFDLARWKRRSLAKRSRERAADLFRQSF